MVQEEHPRRGGIVAMRAEMYERALQAKKNRGYSRQRDSFEPIQPTEEVVPQTRQITQTARSIDFSPRQSIEDERDGVVPGESALIESGTFYYMQGEYEKSFKSFNTALKTHLADPEHDELMVAKILGHLGPVQLRRGNIEEAENALHESLSIKQRLKPQTLVADILNNLGTCANMRGDFPASLEYYRAALKDLRQKAGLRLDVCDTLFNIGRLEVQQKKWQSAIDVLSETWKITVEVYGEEHVYVAQTLELIGYAQLSLGETDSAMLSFTAALASYRQTHGPIHASVANALFNIGLVREAKGDLVDAWEAFTTSRDLYLRLGTHGKRLSKCQKKLTKLRSAIARKNKSRLVAPRP